MVQISVSEVRVIKVTNNSQVKKGVAVSRIYTLPFFGDRKQSRLKFSVFLLSFTLELGQSFRRGL